MIRRLFFSLGVLLGVVAPQAAPELSARIFRTEEALYVNAEVAGAFPESAVELAEAGTEVAFRLEARLPGTEPAVATRSLRFDQGSREWVVGNWPEGERKRLRELPAALVLAGQVWSLRIAPLSALEGGGRVELSARPGILDAGGGWHEAGILWGYAEPTRSFSFSAAVEVPR